MTITIPPPRRPYDDEPVDVGVCTECLALVEVVDLTDCGTHQLCPDCFAGSPCSACAYLRANHAADMAEQATYEAWRDRTLEEDR